MKQDGKNDIIITITTDWERNDFYQGVLQGKLLSVSSAIRLVELSHRVPVFDYVHAAFLMKHSFRAFPKGTIHICMVNSESSGNQMLVFELDNHFLILPDNGMIGLIAEGNMDKAYSFPLDLESSFSSLNSVTTAVESIVNQSIFTDSALITTTFKQSIPFRAASDGKIITGSVIYIDSYQNAITNITREQFYQAQKERRFEIYLQSINYKISEMSNTYTDVEEGELVAFFNSVNMLEIAVHNGFIAELLSLEVGSSIMVKFFDN